MPPAQEILSPILRLVSDPRKETPHGGGKNRDSIRRGSENQLQFLSRNFGHLKSNGALKASAKNNKVILLAQMFSDSYAPSYTPDDLFTDRVGTKLIAAFQGGYLVEVDVNSITRLQNVLEGSLTIAQQVDVSRVQVVLPFSKRKILKGKSIDSLWDKSQSAGGTLFSIRPMPFSSPQAKEAVKQIILREFRNGSFTLPVEEGAQNKIVESWLSHYVAHQSVPVVVRFSDKEALSRLVASGGVFRIQPVAPLKLAEPGEGTEPDRDLPNLNNMPVVGLLDGGLSAPRYQPAVAWREAAVIKEPHFLHGNKVASVAVHAHAWNNNLNLPSLFCRVGVAPILSKNPVHNTNFLGLLNHFDRFFSTYKDTKVWNLSANQEIECGDEVDELSHDLAVLARKHDILLVVSAGNRENQQERIAPPAACEAALVVSGRQSTEQGKVGDACTVSREGLGPDDMLKPDISWFSRLRLVGGVVETGTSYSTPLVSQLAAHTWGRLKNPNPDLVKAILLNNCELEAFDHRIGWGTPFHDALPWECKPGTVTLAWTSNLNSGLEYSWDNIVIPPSLIQNGKLKGTIQLTSILQPILNPLTGQNYFGSRLEVSLQDVKTLPNGEEDRTNILGSMPVNTSETIARDLDAKWFPVRVHRETYPRGKELNSNKLRLRARIFTRDLFQYPEEERYTLASQEYRVSFVLTFISLNQDANTYNTFVQQMGTNVESAIDTQISQQIDISH